MRFQILGGLGARDDTGAPVDLGGPKQRAVLASLLVALGRPVSPDVLCEHVWGDDPPANPETSLQAYVSNLRRALEPDRRPREAPRLLVTQPAGYALLADRADVDATRFEDAVRAGQAALADDDTERARELLVSALELWSGPPLPELAGAPWVDEVAAWLQALRRDALEARAEAGLRLGEHRELVPVLERAITLHPFDERLRAQHALALYRSGRQRDALDALARARRTLREEVGVEPGPELRQLEADVLEQSPSLDLAPRARPDGRRAPTGPAVGTAGQEPAATTAPQWGRRRTDAPATGADRPFVGRARDVDAVLVAATAAAGGAGRPVVISGEPGIGKTRLVEEVVSRLPASAFTAWGRCPESAASAAYWPVIQIGRQLEGAGILPEELAAELLPADDAPLHGDDPTADRFHLHVAVTKLLASLEQPVVLVVDDLQWADASSLRVIEFIAGELRSMPVLLVVTVRPPGPDASPPLIDCLAELARQPGAVRIDLSGLSTDDVQEWLRARTGGSADRRVAQIVHDRTGGNAFFVSEVVELLVGDGRPLDEAALARTTSGVPAAVHDVVRRRVSRLPAETQQVLAAASVVGRSFDIDVLAAVTDDRIADVLDLLDPALTASLVEDTDVPGRFQFSHALVAETLAAEVSPARRARLHASTARAIARLRASDLEGNLADMAHHAVEGAIAGTADEAYEWSVLAAQHATARLAHEEAAGHWERARRALELARPDDLGARLATLEAEGRAWLSVDDVESATRALVAAVDLAAGLGDAAAVARAAAAMSVDGVWMSGEVGLTDVDAVGGLERALEAMPPGPSIERALALGSLAEVGYWRLPVPRLDELSAEGVAVARATGDPATLARALHKRNLALWRAGTIGERRAAAEEAVAVATREPVPAAVEALVHFGLGGVQWEQGDVREAVVNAHRAKRFADEVGAPALLTQLDYFLACLAAFAGRLEESRTLADRAYELYRRTRRWEADALYHGTLMPTLVEMGRFDEVAAVADRILDTPYRPWFVEGYAFALTEVGRLDEAAALLDGADPPLLDCWLYLGVLGAATHTRVALGDRDGVARLVEHLERHSDLLAATGTGPAFGDVRLALAAALHLLGDDDRARVHATASVERLRATGAGPWLVRALLLHATVHPEAAEADRAEAATLARTLDLTLLQERLRA